MFKAKHTFLHTKAHIYDQPVWLCYT